MKRVLLLVLLTISTLVFSNSYIKEVSSSESTDLNNPGEYAVDGDLTRGWALDMNEDNGWILLKLEDKFSINGLIFDEDISSDSRITITYLDDNGVFRDFYSSINSTITQNSILDLSFDNVVTNEVKIKLWETGTNRSVITDIKVLHEDFNSQLRLVEPDDIEASSTTSVYSPEYNLVDGNPETYWRIENNLDWSRVQWAVKAYLDDRFDYDRYSSWGNSGSVEFEFDDKLIEKIKFFVPESIDLGSGFYRLEVLTDDEWIVLSDGERLSTGWIEHSFNRSEVDKVLLTVISDSYNNFPGIGEVEFWGVSEDLEDLDEDEFDYVTPGFDPLFNINDTYFEWESSDSLPEIEVSVSYENNNPLLFNGKEIEPYRTVALDGSELKLFRPDVKDFFDGYNFVELVGNNGIRLRERSSEGLVYSGNDVSGEDIILLDSNVLLERVEVYVAENTGAVLFAYVNDDWVELGLESSYGFKNVYSGGVTSNQLKISYGGKSVREVKVWGSEYPDIVPDIKILHPYNGVDLFSHEPGYNVFVGEIDQTDAEITVNGVPAETYGNIFWVELRKLNLPKAGLVELEVVARSEAGVVSTKSINILLQHNGYRDSVDGDDVVFTNDNYITIEGVSNQWRSKLLINGEEYSINGHWFSHDIELVPGLNVFKIEFIDKKGKVVKLFTKRVYRYGDGIILKTSKSYNELVTNRDSITISGFVMGYGETEVEVNGEDADVDGFTFTSDEIKLIEGVNPIVITAEDDAGNSKEIVLTVIKDSVAPEVSNITPVLNEIISTEDVVFRGNVTEDLGTRVFVNGFIGTISDTNFSRELFLPDGLNDIEIYAIDRAGNRSESFFTKVLTDTVPPESFSVFADPSFWTNNTRPVLTFGTTDVTSGVDYYELKVGAGSWKVIESPYVLGALSDDIHTTYVRAVDKAGHKTTESTKVYIDTTKPIKPEVFRAIPKDETIELNWAASSSDDTRRYTVKRYPNWVNGDKSFNASVLSYMDNEVEKFVCYEYEIVAIDRAENVSDVKRSEKAVVGIEVKKHDNETGTVVEYEDISIIIPQESLPGDVEEIHVTEVISDDLVEKASNYIIGPIYNTSVIREVNGKRVHQEHIAFEKDFLGTLSYNEEDLPDGILEQNIGVYYFDPMWGRWFLIEDSAVDRENNRVIFKTNHFTDFSVQPIIMNELTPQDYKAMGVSPNVDSGHSGVVVDPQSGAMSMTVEEFNLPGKAGFDFTLRRTYNSVRARRDSFNMALASMLDYTLSPEEELKIGDKLEEFGVNTNNKVYSSMVANLLANYQNNGDYAYSMGAGWRLDLPSINNTNSFINITLPGGVIYNVNQMDLMTKDIPTKGNTRELVFESHTLQDFKLIIRQGRYELQALKTKLLKGELNNGDIVSGSGFSKINSWSMYEAELILKNGTRYTFDSLGRIKKIIDPYGVNEVSFVYDSYKLSKIVDSMLREIKFEYNLQENGSIKGLVPFINKITVKGFDGSDSSIEYTINTDGNMGLLTQAKDLKGRAFNYSYDSKVLTTGADAFTINKENLINNFLSPGGINSIANEVVGVNELELGGSFNANFVDALKSVDGPGIGTTTVNYSPKALLYSQSADADEDHFNGLYPVEGDFSYNMLETLVVDDTAVSNGINSLTTGYTYNFVYAGYKQFTNRLTRVNDGKKLTNYVYKNFHLARNVWIDLSTTGTDVYKEHVDRYYLHPTLDKVEVFTEETIPPVPPATEETIKTTTYRTRGFNYNPISLRLESQYEKQGLTGFISTESKYDNWGNVVYQKESTNSNGRATTLETWIDYFGTTNPSPFSEASTVVNPTINYTHSGDIKNLVKSVVVKNHLPTEAGGGSTLQKQLFDYSTNHRLNKSYVLNGAEWVNTAYEYDPVGNISKITDPDTNITELKWDYTGDKWYILTETIKDVVVMEDSGSTTKKDIVTVSAFDNNRGLLAWEKDPRGYYTEYSYDSLGRLLGTNKTGSTTIPEALLSIDYTKNYFEKISYDDTGLIVTITNQEGNKVAYSYNKLGQLTQLDKGDSTKLTTKLVYDNYGNITKISNPEEKETTYSYDLLDRNSGVTYPGSNYGDGSIVAASKSLNFNYMNNTQTIKNEEEKEFFRVFNVNTRLLSEGYVNEYSSQVITAQNFYDGLGNVVLTIDGNGNKTKYIFNNRNLLEKVELPSEKFYEEDVTLTPYIKYGYNKLGQRTSESRSTKTTGVDYTTTFNTDVLGRVYEVVTPVSVGEIVENISQKFVFDDNGNNTVILDGRGKKTTFEFNELNQMVKKTDPKDGVTRFAYDSQGNVKSMSDPRAGNEDYDATFTIDYFYDEYNRLDYALLPQSYGKPGRNKVQFIYDANSNVINRTEYDYQDNILKKLGYKYNDRNMLLEEYQLDSADNEYFNTKYGYDKSGLRTSVTDKEKRSTKTDYDELGRVVSITHDSGSIEKFKWDNNGNQIEFIDGRNNVTTTSYDSYNRVKTISKLVTGGNDSIINYKYDERGNRVLFEDGINNVTRYSFDELNRLVGETNSRGFTASYKYDNAGNISNKTDFNGSKFTYTYLDTNLLESVKIVNKSETISKSLTYTYDEAGALISSTDDSVTTRYNYLESADKSFKYQPDPFDKVFNITTELDGRSDTIDYNYDDAGRITSIKYPTANTVTSSYNELGQLTKLVDYADTFSYYSNGLLNGYSAGNGVKYSSEYDADNRLMNFNYTDSGSNSLDSYSFTYDDSNNIKTKVVNGKNNEYTWDALNQLIQADNQGRFEIDPYKLDGEQRVGKVDRDVVGQKTLDFTPADTELMLDYNSVSIGFYIGDDVDISRLVIKPDAINHRLNADKLAIYTSDDNNSWSIVNRDNWRYEVKDDGNIELILSEPITAKFVKVHCFYDDRDRRGRTIEDKVTVKNSRNTLITAFYTVSRMIENFRYDGAGNREEYAVDYSNGSSYVRTYSYYAGSNLIKTDEKFGYIWDKNGNLIEKSDTYTIENGDIIISPDSGNYTKYTYDLLNRLVKVQIAEKGKNNIIKTINYTYDHRGYRLKRVGLNNDTTYYSFGLNGEVLYKENTTKDKFTNYIYLFGKHFAKEIGKNSDTEKKTERFYYHTDHLGSIIATTDREGKKVWSNNYTSFGESTYEDGEHDEEATYTGKEIDPDTGLYYFNARWYDPQMGRFITEDPIKDGNNWYVYCRNNPLTFIDPDGLRVGRIISHQYMNVGVNLGAQMRSSPSTGWSETKGPHTNTVSLYGCLMTATVNVINSYNKQKDMDNSPYSYNADEHNRDITVKEFAQDDSISMEVDNPIKTTLKFVDREFDFSGNEQFGNLKAFAENTDVNMDSRLIEKALEKYTGDNWTVTSNIKGINNIKKLTKLIAENKDSTTYIMLRIKGHWVNAEVDEQKNLKVTETLKWKTKLDPNEADAMKIAFSSGTKANQSGNPNGQGNYGNSNAPSPHPFSLGSKHIGGDK